MPCDGATPAPKPFRFGTGAANVSAVGLGVSRRRCGHAKGAEAADAVRGEWVLTTFRVPLTSDSAPTIATAAGWQRDVAGTCEFDRLHTRSTRHVYGACMSRVRTNIEIEDTYVKAIMDRFGVHTKTEAVDLALRHLAGQPMTRDEALAMRGARAILEIPTDSAPA